ncbi:hypothetical protein Cpir12675_000678 [Ceratocystis pirilliformis]|uniref:Uncharacterized protein n=1 Tax=Ceratocystis pirilliformis TaxID=259994 RepID=A0ABR3ZJB0_9PEZI
MEAQANITNMLDYHNRLVADVLARFRKLCIIATSRAAAVSTDLSSMSISGMSMDLEFEGLNKSIKELLTLSRRIKELWVFGPLGQEDVHARERAAAVELDVKHIAQIISAAEDGWLRGVVEDAGGSWMPMPKDDEAQNCPS